MTATVINLEDEGARSLPHTPEAEDPYYIGDCYERNSVPSEWEIDSSDTPYLTHIKSLAKSWKPLRFLADFMEVGTTPLRWADLKTRAKQRKERAEKVNVTYIKSSKYHDAVKVSLKDATELRRCVLELKTGRVEEDGTSHVLVVEDLSRVVIDILGMAFNIDPFFFREQIDDYSWFSTRDPWANPPALIAAMKHRSWFRMRNVRLHYFKSESRFKEARQEINGFNVLRRLDDDMNNWHFLDKPGSIVSLTRTRTSIWSGSTRGDGQVNLGIVLTDPTIKAGEPLWSGHSNWMPTPTPDIAKDAPAPVPADSSLYQEIVTKTTTYPWFSNPILTPNSTSPSSSPNNNSRSNIIAAPSLYAIAAEWLTVCHYIKARLSQIEWELEKSSPFRAGGDAIGASLQRLHVWRRVIPEYREMVAETLEQALPAAMRLLSSPSSPSSLSSPPFSTTANKISIAAGGTQTQLTDIMYDFARTRTALNELQSRIDRLSSIVTAEISIEDSRRGLVENYNVSRLTWLATTFIPLSFVTGLFSMQNDLSEMRRTFGWYFLAAVPLTAIVLVVARRVGREWREEGLGRGEGKRKE